MNSHILLVFLMVGLLLACSEPVTPSERPIMAVDVYTQGDDRRGQVLYEKHCLQCHQLQIGQNEKGPHLLRVYQAPAGLLTDYRYSDGLKNANVTWTAENLSAYIANPKQFIANTRMYSKPVTNDQERQDIIAYLSTLK